VSLAHLLSKTIESGSKNAYVNIAVLPWHWIFLLGVIAVLLLTDLLVVHRSAHALEKKEAFIQSFAWITGGLSFAAFIAWQFGGNATGEYIGSYLMEMSLSADNVFIWAVLLAHFKIPSQYQHRVLFWGVIGAVVLRSLLIFGGIALLEIFEPAIVILGLFLVYAAFSLSREKDDDKDFNPSEGSTLRLFHKVIPSTDEIRGSALFIRDTKRGLVATPLFAVVVLLELTDAVFALDSVSAVLTITSEQFLAVASNAFAILGLRSLYFLLADVQAKFKYLQRGIALILGFVGFKMIVAYFWDWHVSIQWSLSFIVLVLGLSVGASIVQNRRPS
jgi:tellurite resistance protein TerC